MPNSHHMRAPTSQATSQIVCQLRHFINPYLLVVVVLLSACDNDRNGDNSSIALPPPDPITPASEARIVLLSREGKIASLDIEAPWIVRASSDLGESIASARCRAGKCVIVLPDPVNAIRVIDAQTLHPLQRFVLPAASDPRDIAFLSDNSIVISLYERSHLLQMNISTGDTQTIDLRAYADDDGLPETMMLASCGAQLYVQLQRMNRATGLPSNKAPLLLTIDTWDNNKTHAIKLRFAPALDMQVNCAERQLIVAEPKTIMEGGGDVERINLNDISVQSFLGDGEFANGGVQVIAPNLYWLNQHTDTGPGPSSHLTLQGAGEGDVYNVFASESVDNMAYDASSNWLFYPNPCSTLNQPDCDNGVHIFNARTGESAGDSIDPGFAPIEVVVSR